MGTTRVLFIEDDASDAFLIQGALQKDFPGVFVITHAQSEADALSKLKNQAFDVCLLDLSLPDSYELSALLHIQHRAPELPILILTGNEDEATGREAVACGAQDYLLKNKAEGPAIKLAIEYAIERKRSQSELTRRAYYDDLTGLVRPDYFRKNLEQALSRCQRQQRNVAVFFIDLDRFKQVNDKCGHEAGDKLLQQVAGVLRDCLRPHDVLARFGGDEFAVFIEDANAIQGCVTVAQRMIRALSNLSVPAEAGNIKVGASIGIATAFPVGEQNVETLLQNADSAMYRAKAKGGGYQIYSVALQEQVEQHQTVNREMQAILPQDQLRLFYQPRIDGTTGRMVGVEALLRWQHPKRGLLAPENFFEAANDAGLQPLMDEWVFHALYADVQHWQKQGNAIPVAINLTKGFFDRDDLTGHWKKRLKAAPDIAPYVILEIAEALLIDPSRDLQRDLQEFAEAGCVLRVDSFGKKVASLLLFQNLPITQLNIDRSLIAEMENSATKAKVVQTIIEHAHKVNVKTTAVGVETKGQTENLLRWRCDELQGYALCPPIEAEKFAQFMRFRMAA
jgi:diguanylate cyclase (GGDEF)-like protein